MIKAILLAAGQSKRIGHENKLTKIYKKKPLINYCLNSLHKSKVNKVIIVLGYQHKEIKKIIKKNRKNIFIFNKDYRKGMALSIKAGLKKVSRNDKGFIVVHSDMPFIKSSDINKIYSSIRLKNFLVYALKFKEIYKHSAFIAANNYLLWSSRLGTENTSQIDNFSENIPFYISKLNHICFTVFV